MKREGSLSDISDGNLYNINDLVKADCNDCIGCSKCCKNMGNTVILDPYDICNLKTNMGADFQSLLGGYIELNQEEGLILPNLLMKAKDNSCAFLNDLGRCSIHSFRPGICRLFPLGRIYENDSFKYFLQKDQCIKENRTKIKIKKWLGINNITEYEHYINKWHYFLKEIQNHVRRNPDSAAIKEINLAFLNEFFIKDFKSKELFCEEIYLRIEKFSSEVLKNNR